MAKKKSKKWRSGEKPRKRTISGWVVAKMQELGDKTDDELLKMYAEYKHEIEEKRPEWEKRDEGRSNTLKEYGPDLEHIYIEYNLGKITREEFLNRAYEVIRKDENGKKTIEGASMEELAARLDNAAHELDILTSLYALHRIMDRHMADIPEIANRLLDADLKFNSTEDIDRNIIQIGERFPEITEEGLEKIRQKMINRFISEGADSSAEE